MWIVSFSIRTEVALFCISTPEQIHFICFLDIAQGLQVAKLITIILKNKVQSTKSTHQNTGKGKQKKIMNQNNIRNHRLELKKQSQRDHISISP